MADTLSLDALCASRYSSAMSEETKENRYKIVIFGSASAGRASLGHIVDKAAPENNRETSPVPKPGGIDFFPLSLGEIRGYKTVLLLFRASSPLLNEEYVFGGSDGIIFVANSDEDNLKETSSDWKTLKKALRTNGLSWKSVPLVVQMDSTGSGLALSESRMRRKLGLGKQELVVTNSRTGAGAFDSVKSITKLVLSSSQNL